MKKLALVLLLVCVLLLSPIALAAKARGILTDTDSTYHAQHLMRHLNTEEGTCTGNYVKVRSKPGGNSVIGHLEQADVFRLVDIQDSFAQIQVTYAAQTSPDSWVGLTGWIDCDYVDCMCSSSAYYGNGSHCFNGYEDIINWYISFITGERNPQEIIDAGFEPNSFVSSLDSDGFLLRDLDDNGIDELIILPKISLSSVPNGEYGYLIAVYTLDNNQPLMLVSSWSRSRNYLRKDGRIYSEGSNGASYAVYYLKTLHGTSFRYEGVLSGDEWIGDEYELAWYYAADDDYDFSNDERITESEAMAMIARFSSRMEDDTSGFISFAQYLSGK